MVLDIDYLTFYCIFVVHCLQLIITHFVLFEVLVLFFLLLYDLYKRLKREHMFPSGSCNFFRIIVLVTLFVVKSCMYHIMYIPLQLKYSKQHYIRKLSPFSTHQCTGAVLYFFYWVVNERSCIIHANVMVKKKKNILIFWFDGCAHILILILIPF